MTDVCHLELIIHNSLTLLIDDIKEEEIQKVQIYVTR